MTIIILLIALIFMVGIILINSLVSSDYSISMNKKEKFMNGLFLNNIQPDCIQAVYKLK